MYSYLLDGFLVPEKQYRIFINVKDSNCGPRVNKLHQVLCNNHYDFKKDVIQDIAQVTSNRTDLLQLTDWIIAALSYYNRGLTISNNTKTNCVMNLVEKTNE